MEDIIHKFGIDGRLIVIQIVNFVALVGLLSYFLYKPLLNVLKEREEKITKGVQDAEAAEQALSVAEDEKKVIVGAAHKEAEEVALRAKAYADEKAAAITAAADQKAADIVTSAEQRGEDIKTQAQKDSEAEIAKLAVLAAEKILKEKTS